jgi:hypothetical protein
LWKAIEEEKMTLQGKGMMIWKIPQCEGGNAQAIANLAVQAGLSHVLIKIADSSYAYNVDKTTGVDLLPPVVDAIRAKGIQVWGWHYIYGFNPLGEAAIAVSQTKKYNLDGYVIDAEIEFKAAGREAVAKTFMTELRKGLPSTPVALSTFRWPTYHQTFPYRAFLEKCDYNMPQVYWVNNNNPEYDLTRSFTEFNAITPTRPMIPTGPAYTERGWAPTPEEVRIFMTTARRLSLSAANFYSWDDSRLNLKPVWDVIANFNWPGQTPLPPTADILERFINALNTFNYKALSELFAPDAVFITPEKTIQGNGEIVTYWGQFLNNRLNDTVFAVTSSSGTDPTRHFTWTADSWRGKVNDGSDTFGLKDGKIVYHYSNFTVTT